MNKNKKEKEMWTDIATWFLPVGDVVVTEDFGKNRTPNIMRSKGYNVFGKDLKMVILVDQGSASASEIVAGALSQHGIAKLVGTKTFGKGSVQELVSVTDDTSLKVTIARWLTPNGHNLSSGGLVPDYEVTIPSDQKSGTDPIMDKALQVLNK
jgi:carboxyl-terminal processing protease